MAPSGVHTDRAPVPEEMVVITAERLERHMDVDSKRASKKKTALDNVHQEEQRAPRACQAAQGKAMDFSSKSTADRGGNDDDDEGTNDASGGHELFLPPGYGWR